MPAAATTEHERCIKLLSAVGTDRDQYLGIPYDWKWAKGDDQN